MRAKYRFLIMGLAMASFLPFAAGTAAAQSQPAGALPANLRAGLKLYFTFDQQEPGGVVTDRSGQGNNGKVTGATWTPAGRQGGAYQFAPSDNYITVPSSPALNGPQISIAVWIKTSCADNVWRRIMDKQWNHGFALSIAGAYTGKGKETSPRMTGHATSEINGRFFPSEAVVADGQWHHLVTTFDGTEQNLYVDGKLQHGGKRWTGVVEANRFDLTIGANRSNPDPRLDEVGASFGGIIDEVMFYDRAVSAAEVQQIMALAGAAVSTPDATPAPAPTGDRVARLKKVKELFDQGLLTQEQYDRKRQEIEQSL